MLLFIVSWVCCHLVLYILCEWWNQNPFSSHKPKFIPWFTSANGQRKRSIYQLWTLLHLSDLYFLSIQLLFSFILLSILHIFIDFFFFALQCVYLKLWKNDFLFVLVQTKSTHTVTQHSNVHGIESDWEHLSCLLMKDSSTGSHISFREGCWVSDIGKKNPKASFLSI